MTVPHCCPTRWQDVSPRGNLGSCALRGQASRDASPASITALARLEALFDSVLCKQLVFLEMPTGLGPKSIDNKDKRGVGSKRLSAAASKQPHDSTTRASGLRPLSALLGRLTATDGVPLEEALYALGREPPAPGDP